MELAEVFQFLDRKRVAGKMQPAVKKHATVAGREDEAVAVEPAGILGIVHQRIAIEHGADLGGAERQAEMAGGGFVHGIHGEATGLVGGFGQDFGLELHFKGYGH
jgi:hypothetical protein